MCFGTKLEQLDWYFRILCIYMKSDELTPSK